MSRSGVWEIPGVCDRIVKSEVNMSEFSEYYVPAGYGQAEFVEKKSKFIGRVWRVASEEEANARINEMREKYWNATHNVYAYRIKDCSLMRYSDDGEPQGTSGMPVLNVFRSAGIYDFCCVVTRYFGGTLLGTGGLVRAYSNTASLALEKAGVSIMKRWLKARIECPYNLYESILKEISNAGGSIIDTDFGENIIMQTLLPENGLDSFDIRLKNLSSGKITAEILGEDYRAVTVI